MYRQIIAMGNILKTNSCCACSIRAFLPAGEKRGQLTSLLLRSGALCSGRVFSCPPSGKKNKKWGERTTNKALLQEGKQPPSALVMETHTEHAAMGSQAALICFAVPCAARAEVRRYQTEKELQRSLHMCLL